MVFILTGELFFGAGIRVWCGAGRSGSGGTTAGGPCVQSGTCVA